MPKIIAAMNMTIDGFCDHTEGIVDDELHQHYNDLLRNAGALIYGRITYQLMESAWPALVKNPSGNKPMDEFAVIIENIPKLVFSRTLQNVEWKNVKLATKSIIEEVSELKERTDKDILVGSPSLIVELMNLNLIDELQLCVHPIIAGKGLILFKDIAQRNVLKLIDTKVMSSGQITLYYEPVRNNQPD